MTPNEKAVFWETLSNKGILIFKKDENFVVSKIATDADIRTEELLPSPYGDDFCGDVEIPVRKPITSKTFSTKDLAIEFVKNYINWQWTETDAKQVAKKLLKSLAEIQYDMGFGPKIHKLGEIEGETYDDMARIAEGKCKEFLEDLVKGTKKEANSIPYKMKILPLGSK